MISKSLSTSKKYAALYPLPLGEFCQSLYPLLVAHADDFGRLEGDVFTVKHSVVPASPRTEIEIQQALTTLDDVQLIAWYDVEGHAFVQIVDFERHQVGLHKRTASRFPRVPGNSRKSRQLPLQLNRTELKGTEGKGSTSSAADAAPRSGSVVNPDDNIGVITKIAHEAIGIEGINADLGVLADAVKSLCAIRSIDYGRNGTLVRKAVDSALAQRKVKAS